MTFGKCVMTNSTRKKLLKFSLVILLYKVKVGYCQNAPDFQQIVKDNFSPGTVSVLGPQAPMCHMEGEEETDGPKMPNQTAKVSCSMTLEEIASQGRATPGSQSREKGQLPPWMDLKLAQKGQKFAEKYLAEIGTSHLYGLIFIIAFPDGRDVLMMTKKSDTKARVERRYSATMVQVLLWYTDHLTENTPPDSPFLTSLRTVRSLHVAAAEKASQKLERKESLVDQNAYKNVTLDEGMWKAFKKDLDDSNIPKRRRNFPKSYFIKGQPVPVNQFIQVLTQFAFIGFPVMFPERIGITDTNEGGLWGLNHLWAVIGYTLGIEDKFNIALQPDLPSTKLFYRDIFEQYYLAALFKLDRTTKILVEALLKGFNELISFLSPNVQLYRLLRYICSIEAPNMKARLTPAEQAVEVAIEYNDNKVVKNFFIAQELRSASSAVQIEALGYKYYPTKMSNKKTRASEVFYA